LCQQFFLFDDAKVRRKSERRKFFEKIVYANNLFLDISQQSSIILDIGQTNPLYMGVSVGLAED